MTPAANGVLAGVAFGLFSVATMVPLKFPDKRAAMAGAFANRFGIGLVIPLLNLSQSGWLVGAACGLLLSVPSAIITKAYIPLLLFGTLGGAVIGGVTRGWH